ncbi:MAG: DUF2179 domain-containing protein [Anaerolineae bacterium]|nr:DUF2179 domain-containing protein [Anaerolineae bacterium]
MDLTIMALIFLFTFAVSTLFSVRMLAITHGRRVIAMLLAFGESVLFIYSLGQVVDDLGQWQNLAAYCLGNATGSVAGITLDARLLPAYVRMSIVAVQDGYLIATKLRGQGFGVTEFRGAGGKEDVMMLHCIVRRQEVPRAQAVIQEVNPQAFITVEEVLEVERGWFRRAEWRRR